MDSVKLEFDSNSSPLTFYPCFTLPVLDILRDELIGLALLLAFVSSSFTTLILEVELNLGLA